MIWKLVRFVIQLCLFIGLSYSNILFNGYSFHNPQLGITYCAVEEDCRHEVGHLMDHNLGDISKTKEFGMATLAYSMYQIKYIEYLDVFAIHILGNPGTFTYTDKYKPFQSQAGSSPQAELYAKLYAQVDGDISQLPEILRPFYTDNKKYDEVYDHLVKYKYHFSKGDNMEEYWNKLVEKVTEHKEALTRIGLTVLGAVVGAVVATAMARSEDDYLLEEMSVSVEEDENE